MFWNTLAGPLNESLKHIVGKVAVPEYDDDSRKFTGLSLRNPPPIDAVPDNQQYWPIRMMSTCDLAYTSRVLGKVNMASKRCPYCDLSNQEWQGKDHAKGNLWTFEKMAEVRRQLELGIIKDEPSNRWGCADVPCLDAIPIEDYIAHSPIATRAYCGLQLCSQ